MDNKIPDIEKYRMPVFSWDYEDCSDSEHWFLMARGYFDCSYHLFSSMASEALDRTYHRGLVAVSMFNHSVELFLKGAIVQAGEKVNSTHNLIKLFQQYKSIYRGPGFDFSGKIEEVIAPYKDMTYNQFARYPTNNCGVPWPGYNDIDVAVWYVEITKFKNDFDRLEPLIKKEVNS